MKTFGKITIVLVAAATTLASGFELRNNNVDSSLSTTTSSATRRAFLQTTAATAAVSLIGASLPSSAQAATTTSIAGGSPRYGDETIMVQKGHGTSSQPVQSELLFGVSNELADRICNYNRNWAEFAGYFKTTDWEKQVLAANGEPMTYYDSVTGKPLFVAPLKRSAEDFLKESNVHGWPSFRDEEVVWENVRILKRSGETVSVDGTHLGHNLPDRKGNRYCINLVCIAGQPTTTV